MAIRVVNTVPDASVVRKTVCRECGVTLEFVPKDMKSRVHHDYGGGSDTNYYIDCAGCGEECRVSQFDPRGGMY